MGVSEARKNQNNKYEHLLGFSATSGDKRNIAEIGIRNLLDYGDWSPKTTMTLSEKIEELQKIYNTANTVLRSVEEVLNYTISDGVYLTATMLTTFKANIDALQTQYNSASIGLVTFLNTSQTFLATYEKERLSREKTIATTEENSQDALTLAKNAYETALKTRDITLKQMNQNIASAGVRLKNAGGNVSRLSITAPVDGVIGKITVDVGEEVTNGRAIMDIASKDAECDITVDSATLAQLQVGTKVVVNYRGQGLP